MVVNAGRMNANCRDSRRPRDGQQHCRHRSEIWQSCRNANELHRSLDGREPEDQRDLDKESWEIVSERGARYRANTETHCDRAGEHYTTFEDGWAARRAARHEQHNGRTTGGATTAASGCKRTTTGTRRDDEVCGTTFRHGRWLFPVCLGRNVYFSETFLREQRL